MGRKTDKGPAMNAEPAAVDGLMAGVMDESAEASASTPSTTVALDVGDQTQAVPADDETSPANELGTDDPAQMTLAAIDSELERTEPPSEYLTRARQELEARLAEIERERDELKTIENVVHTDYHAAQKFAHELAKRRQALTNERKRRG